MHHSYWTAIHLLPIVLIDKYETNELNVCLDARRYYWDITKKTCWHKSNQSNYRKFDFDLYVEILCKLIPWCVCLRPCELYPMDMCSCASYDQPWTHVSWNCWVTENCRKGGRISVYFLRLQSIKHAHEQNKVSVNDDGDAMGLTQYLDAFRRWSVAGTEITSRGPIF